MTLHEIETPTVNPEDDAIIRARSRSSDAAHHIAGAFWVENKNRRQFLLRAALAELKTAVAILEELGVKMEDQ